jgi:hypothetical protein
MVPVAVPETSALRVVFRGAGPLAGVGVRVTPSVGPPTGITQSSPAFPLQIHASGIALPGLDGSLKYHFPFTI